MPLVRALQISPRASFAELAAALELSEPTVARRYRWATANGLLRVVGVLDTRRLGQSQWMVRVRPRPSEIARTAAALAARDEVRWVTIDNGGFGITCAVLARTAEQRTALLADRLAGARDVVDLHAVEILHQYTGGRAHYWSTFEGVLSLEQERLLGAAGAPFAESTGEGPRPR
ncbi:Lrp/AsnC family transcriptional regulator [Amnibacterium kyonggiense]